MCAANNHFSAKFLTFNWNNQNWWVLYFHCICYMKFDLISLSAHLPDKLPIYQLTPCICYIYYVLNEGIKNLNLSLIFLKNTFLADFTRENSNWSYSIRYVRHRKSSQLLFVTNVGFLNIILLVLLLQATWWYCVGSYWSTGSSSPELCRQQTHLPQPI